jgi:hypothetical protein
LRRLVIALQVVWVELGACGMRLVCLILELTGLNRFVGASYGTQQQVNRGVEEATVAYRREERARLNASKNICGISKGLYGDGYLFCKVRWPHP